ncbi:MAG: single-stranded-DNA-specific exonuclease RecJ [Halanaerobiales bacterium]
MITKKDKFYLLPLHGAVFLNNMFIGVDYMIQKKWYVEKRNIADNSSDLNQLLLEILHKRGLQNQDKIEQYLNPRLDNLHDPYLLKDMDKAVKRIARAVEKGENIIIFGDYDVDGITSTALLYHFFCEFLEITPAYYLPDRFEEGYGLNREAIENFAGNYDLLLTVDCGITAQTELTAAHQLGLDVIVTDHHQTGDSLPQAVALINPHRQDDEYPCKKLAGVGVAFKLCQALCHRLDLNEDQLYRHLDLVALGTVADIVPLREENRIFVRFGLERVLDTEKPGLKALVNKKGLDGEHLTAGSVGYVLAPPLNAAGRMKDPETGIKLLITSDREEAENIAQSLIETNRERQEEEERIMQEAVKKVENEVDLEEAVCLVLASDDWHQGVIGIVASRLVEKYYLPTVMVALDGEKGKGSCRSIGALDMFSALKHCSRYLVEYGGHAAAAGLEITRNKLSDFHSCFSAYIREKLEREDFIPGLTLDAVLHEEEITRDLYDELYKMRPFGVANPRPRFLLENINPEKFYCVGSDNSHLKVQLAGGVEGIGFGMGEICEKLENTGQNISLAGTISLNSWNGKEEVQIKIEDIKFSEQDFFHPICCNSDSLEIVDLRGYGDKSGYLDQILARGRKAAIYCNSSRKRLQCLQSLPGEAVFISGEDDNIWKFDQVEKGLLFFSTSSFSSDITARELVLYSLPYSLEELKNMVSLISPERLHFIFNREDYYYVLEKIKKRIPTRRFLRKLYAYLYEQVQERPGSEINISELEIEEGTALLYQRACAVLEELELLEFSEGKVTLLSRPEKKLDLSDSLRYNENIKIIEDFNELSALVFDGSVIEILEALVEY